MADRFHSAVGRFEVDFEIANLQAQRDLSRNYVVCSRLRLDRADLGGLAGADKHCQAAIPASAGTDVQLSFYFPTAEDSADNADHRLTCVFDNSGDASPSS